MRNSVYTIFRKEIARFFMDKRLVFSIIILPGLMIFIMYSFLGNIINKEIDKAVEHRSKIYVRELPESLEERMKGLNAEIIKLDKADYSKELEEIKEKKSELLVVFESDFDHAVDVYETKQGGTAPQIEIYYNSSRDESRLAHKNLTHLLDEYEESLSNKFDVNKKVPDGYDLASKEDVAGKVFGGMFPMLLMIFMWSGCLAVAPESIAGEKERGTIATLLITPTKRRDIALGKILALSLIAFFSGGSSFIGTFTSFPTLTKGMGEEFSTMSYGVMDFLILFLIIISTVLLLVAIISVISAFAKSVKEAATLASPVMVVIMIISFLPGLLSSGEGKEPFYMFFVPLYNSVLCMNDIFKFHYEISNILMTVGANFAAVVILAAVLTKLFNSEKVMFAK